MPLFGIGNFDRLMEKIVAKFDRLNRLLKRIARNDPSLHQVNLRGKHIGDDGAKRLAVALRSNTVVTELYLGWNRIGVAGARALADMLKNNLSITKFDLQSNRIGDEGAISAEGATALAEILRNNSSVTFYSLFDCGIGDDSATALAEALEINSSVSKLNLGVNSISSEGARALAEALRHNSSVTTLVMRGNSIGNAGVLELVEMLLVNSSIIDLELWIEDIDPFCNDISVALVQRVYELTKINDDALNLEEAHRLKIVCKVRWLLESEFDGEKEEAVALALDRLGSFPEADQRRGLFEKLLGLPEHGADVAASVDVATARTLFRYAADCGAAPGVVMNLMRAHPSLCTCRNVKHHLFPFMLLATTAEAGAGDVLELLLLNPNLVESGISETGVQLD